MDSNVRYTTLGFFTIVLTALLFSIILWLTHSLNSKSYATYSTDFKESVSGLSVHAPVKYNGVDIGFVKDIRFDSNQPQRVRVLLDIESNIAIYHDVTATLETQGLTGLAYIELRGGTPHSALAHAMLHGGYPHIRTRPSLMGRLDTTIQVLTHNLDQIAIDLRKILSSKNQVSLEKSLHHIASLSESLDRTYLPALLNTLKTTTQEASETFAQTRYTFESLNQNTLPALQDNLNHLRDMTQTWNTLGHELTQQPGILLHGKTPRHPGPGENA